MGCAKSLRKDESDVTNSKNTSNGLKSFYFTMDEFNLPMSDDEDELLSIQSKHYQDKIRIPQKTNQSSVSGVISNAPSTVTHHSLLDNRLEQTGV